jgi:thiamine-phosphate pyrophosphorylase
VHLSARADVRAARICLDPDVFVGVSAHCERDVPGEISAGADCTALSRVFPQQAGLRAGAQSGCNCASSCVWTANPGSRRSDARNAAGCLDAGAAGVAVMGAIAGALDPRFEAAALSHTIRARLLKPL